MQHETVSESGGSWWGYGASLASLAANIVENIQVSLNKHLLKVFTLIPKNLSIFSQHKVLW